MRTVVSFFVLALSGVLVLIGALVQDPEERTSTYESCECVMEDDIFGVPMILTCVCPVGDQEFVIRCNTGVNSCIIYELVVPPVPETPKPNDTPRPEPEQEPDSD